MAEGGKLVLSNVLCFVGNNIGKIPVKKLKSILCDFYDAEVLCEAKVRLLDCVKSRKQFIARNAFAMFA